MVQPEYPYGGNYGKTPKTLRLQKKNGLRPIHGPLSSRVPMGPPPGAGLYDEFKENRTPMQKNWYRRFKDKEAPRKRELGMHIGMNKFKGFTNLPQYAGLQMQQVPGRVITRTHGMTNMLAAKGHEVTGPLIKYPKVY